MQEKVSRKILLIEDEKELVFGLTTLLKQQGYLIIAAYDSVFGISLAHKEKPDLIILDLGLPAGGGLYVLENLKNSVETLDIPVLVLTAQQGIDLEEKAKQMGAVAYFHKPFDPESLSSQVKEILDNSS
ncbi:MAG: response regulator [Candidatus Omnitrophica bacterium]|nr:response regulator [Candidatus Omnitrophota bacterium]